MKDVTLIPVNKELIQTMCMWCATNYADYFVVRLARGAMKFPLTICEKCAKKEGLKRGNEVSGADADTGKRFAGT